MSSDLVESDAINIVKGFCQSGSTDVVRRTGFKLERQFVEGTVRASFAMYNTRSEVDALVAGIERVSQMF